MGGGCFTLPAMLAEHNRICLAGDRIKEQDTVISEFVALGEAVEENRSGVNHTGYERDVTAKAEIAAVEGGLSVSYTENGITLSGILADGSDETVFFSVAHLEALIAQA